MAEPLYIAKADIEKVAGLHRTGTLESGRSLDFGVHGSIKSLYGLDAEPDLPLPVDYIVAATGG